MSNPKIANMNIEQNDKKTYFYQEMCRRIISSEFAPESVLDEVGLSKEFGMSRPPIREVMRQLASEGYIELEANRPARVASMGYQELRNFYLAMPFVYTSTSQLAAMFSTSEELIELKQIQQNFKQAIVGQDGDARNLYNWRFHQKIGFMAHNKYLLPSLNRVLIDHARIGKFFYQYPAQNECVQSWDDAVMHHDQLIAEIEARRTSNIEQIIDAHCELSRGCFIDYLTPSKSLSFSISK